MLIKISKKLSSGLILLPLIFLTSCGGLSKNKSAEIRIVDVNGNPKPVKRFVPEQNAQILASQGMKIDQKTGEILSNRTPAPEASAENKFTPPLAANNASQAMESNMTNIAPTPIAPSITAQTMSTSTLPTPSTNETANKSSDNTMQEAAIEYDMNDSAEKTTSDKSTPNANGKKFKVNVGKTSEKEVAAKISKEKTIKGTFVQIGSFSSLENANKALIKAKKIGKSTIEEVEIDGKKSYRALIGPIPANKAKALLKKAVKAGYRDAFIVKNK